MKVFITGGSGLLGSYLVPLLRENYEEVWAPSHQEFDICEPDETYLDVHWDIVINLAAFVDVAACERDKETAFLTNNLALFWLNYLSPKTQIYHISTDYVYDGDTHCSREDDLPNPWCVYGRTKAAGDMKLLSCCRSNIHIIRTSFKPIKWPYPGAFSNVYTNADTVDIIAGLIERFISKEPPGGVYNIGTAAKSLYNLARKNNPNVLETLFSKDKFPTVRPYLTMDLYKFRAVIND
jgi:nucleoside-diphosphate-sugar epimerase